MRSGLIADSELAKVKIVESGEPMLDVAALDRNIVVAIEATSASFQGLAHKRCYLRAGAAKRLALVQASLPNGLRLKIIDGYRPLGAQRAIYKEVIGKIRERNPRLPEAQLRKAADRLVANSDVIIPPHSTGGAVDLTIVDKHGRELCMGSKMNSLSKKARTGCTAITKKAGFNRLMLAERMQKQGFVNYPLEWWHWSYGDSYWAASSRTYAIYGPLDL